MFRVSLFTTSIILYLFQFNKNLVCYFYTFFPSSHFMDVSFFKLFWLHGLRGLWLFLYLEQLTYFIARIQQFLDLELLLNFNLMWLCRVVREEFFTFGFNKPGKPAFWLLYYILSLYLSIYLSLSLSISISPLYVIHSIRTQIQKVVLFSKTSFINVRLYIKRYFN